MKTVMIKGEVLADGHLRLDVPCGLPPGPVARLKSALSFSPILKRCRSVRPVFQRSKAAWPVNSLMISILNRSSTRWRSTGKSHCFPNDSSRQIAHRLVDLSSVDSFQLEPVLLEDIENLPAFEAVPEMHDRILVIQANRLGVAMITKDESIQKANVIEIIWN